ncbi:TOMM precursor leader peptide-binding protein [Streptomyces sp. NPDC006879]|uniref:TOMM precursor leader peptide-binding protein n=1 Tax=Streptomyces sp. NPDC006879 TaxID=3364767 RepID=UPI0036B0011C
MYPMMKPALRRAWRDLNTVQCGITPAHAITVGPLDPGAGCFLGSLDGTRGMSMLRAEARALNLCEGRADDLVRGLARAGLVEDLTRGGPAAQALREHSETLDRLRPDLASLSLMRPEPGSALRTLAARSAIRVQVRGAGRVGAVIAALLSGAGIGHVEVLDGGRVEPADVAPGGLSARSLGELRGPAAHRSVREASPGPSARATTESRSGTPHGPALVVVAPRDGLGAYAPETAAAEGWIAAGTPHLYAGVLEATGMVGPLVLPGGTACAGCVERERQDQDEAWARMLVQWRLPRSRPAPACDLALAAAVAGLAAAHALAFLDGDLPASTGARWEVTLPVLDWRSTPLRPHAQCPCGAAAGLQEKKESNLPTSQDTMAT